MAKIYNSINDPQSQAGLLARNLYTSEQIEYKLRQKVDKTIVYTKKEVDSRLLNLSNSIVNNTNTLSSLFFQLNQENSLNVPLKWNGEKFLSCLDEFIPDDSISQIPLGWNSDTKTLTSLFPTLDTGKDRNNDNFGIYLGRQTIINGGTFNLDSVMMQEDPDFSKYPTEIYDGSGVLWKQFEPNNRIIIKHSIDEDNNSLGQNSLYTGELAININTGDIFVGWEGKSQNTLSGIVLDGIKEIFSPRNYIQLNPSEEQTIIPNSLSNIPSLMIKGSNCLLGSEDARADILQIYDKEGYKKVYVNARGELNTEFININLTPESSTDSITHKIPIKVSGKTYYILLSDV